MAVAAMVPAFFSAATALEILLFLGAIDLFDRVCG